MGQNNIINWGIFYYASVIINWDNFVLLQIGASVIANWANFILLQIGASVITNWGSFFITNWGSLIITNQGSYYELGQPLLQIGAAITNSGNYYKLGHNSTSERVNFLKRRLANIQSFFQKLEPEE